MPGPALRSGSKNKGIQGTRQASEPDLATVADEEVHLPGDMSPGDEEDGSEGADSPPEAGPSTRKDPGTRGASSEDSRSASGSPTRTPVARGPLEKGGSHKGPAKTKSVSHGTLARESGLGGKGTTSRGRALKRSRVLARKRREDGSSDSSSSASPVQRTRVGPDPVGSGGAAGAVVDTPAAPDAGLRLKIRRRRREVMPPLYDGKGVAFTDYLEEFERVAEFNSWSKDERCFHLWTNISGPARQKIVALKYKKDWGKMVDLLKSKFCSTRALDANELNGSMQNGALIWTWNPMGSTY